MSTLRDNYYNLVYGQEPTPVKIQTRRPFINETFGNDLAQNVAFSGTPVLINNGGDSAGWTPSITSGGWDPISTTDPYAGTACVELTSGADGDTLNLSTGSPVDGSNYIAVDLRIRLETWNPSNNALFLQFKNGGTPVGVLLDVDNFIDTAILGSYQHAIIPMSLLGLDAATFDELDVSITRSGGPAPVFRFDNFNVQELGGIVEFIAGPNLQLEIPELIRLEKIRLTFVATVTGNAALDYDNILGVVLTNGIQISRVINGVQQISRSITSRADLLAFDFNTVSFVDDGTESTLVVEVSFAQPLLLRGKTADTVGVTIEDDLSSFVRAEALMTGTFENEI